MRRVSFERALERIGYGPFQRRLLWLCGLGWAADAMEILLVSFALPAMAAEWGLEPAQKGLLATAIFLGMLFGALFWGRLSDLIGRRIGFAATVGIDSLFGLASAFAPNFGVFALLRAITGFGVGGTLPVDYAIFAEFLPARERGKRLVLLESFWALGSVAAAGLAWLIVPRLGWRALFAASALPGLLLFLLRRRMPESPRFLAASGRAQEARAILVRVAAENGVVLEPGDLEGEGESEAEGKPEGEFAAEPAAVTPRRGGAYRQLLAPGLRRVTLGLWLVWFLISIGYYGAFTWLPSWLRAKGIALPSVYPYAFAMALAQLPGYFSAAFLVERWGRRLTLGVYLAASGVCAFAFSFAEGQLAVAAGGLALSFFALGAWGALYAYTPEVYPTRIRATGVGAASAWTRLAGVLAPFLGAFAANAGPLSALGLYAAAYLAAALAALALLPETRGHSLD